MHHQQQTVIEYEYRQTQPYQFQFIVDIILNIFCVCDIESSKKATEKKRNKANKSMKIQFWIVFFPLRQKRICYDRFHPTFARSSRHVYEIFLTLLFSCRWSYHIIFSFIRGFCDANFVSEKLFFFFISRSWWI